MAPQRLCSIEDCGKPHLSRGWCAKHYRRWKAHGDPNAITSTENGVPLRWLIEHLSYGGDDCILWPFAKGPHGYGGVRVDGVDRRVNRLVCEKVHGTAPSSKHQAAHSCGNRLCINPNHLRWATRSENENDKLEHGTSNRGQRNGQAKLTHDDILEIRSLSGALPQSEIARRFGICQQTVSDIVRRKRWRWL